MILEFPDYYETFQCIGSKCPDTCCAGWEVDVDPDSCEYYQSIQGPFGDRLRKALTIDGEDRYFPLDPAGRCPFLDHQNLCDIYKNLGEASLCQTCTEYPRYFMDIGNYEQIDMSLSCMELGRIFFSDTTPVSYVRTENNEEGEPLTPEDQQLLIEILALRNKAINLIQHPDRFFLSGWGAYMEDLKKIFALCQEAENASDEELAASRAFQRESYSDLYQCLSAFDVISDQWSSRLPWYRQIAAELDRSPEFLLHFLTQQSAEFFIWFRKLTVYFIYRYFIDTCIDQDPEIELCLLYRSLRSILLMLIAEKQHTAMDSPVSRDEFIYIAHLFSKEVEHDEENVTRIKGLSNQ